MKARMMRHEGKSKITVPAEVSRYFDPGLMDYVQQEITPAREIEYDLPAGSKYGGYPVRKDVLVPIHAQKPLYDKGFRFVKDGDEAVFLKERAAIEAEIKRRADAVKPEAPKEEPKKEEPVAEVEPSGDLLIGDAPAAPVEEKKQEENTEPKKSRRDKTPPADSNEGGN